MYIIIVVCLMLVFPIAGVGIEHWAEHGTAPLMLLIGKWFVFFGVGWRLLLAGLRQYFQPRFTAEQIFKTTNPDVLVVIRELGSANLAAGVVGFLSLWFPDFVLPAAIGSGLFYAIAGIRHVAEHDRSTNETVAMISDLGIAIVLAAYVVWRLVG
jgi:hypothetical protein